MKRKLLSLALTLAMVTALMPPAVASGQATVHASTTGELLAALDFRPAPEWGARLGCRPEDAERLVAAEAPLWRALGRERPWGDPQARVWLTWGRP